MMWLLHEWGQACPKRLWKPMSQKQYSYRNLFIYFNSGGQSCHAYIAEGNSVATCFIIVFMKSSLNWEVYLIHSKLFVGSFYDIAQPYLNYLHPNIEDMTIDLFLNSGLFCNWIQHFSRERSN